MSIVDRGLASGELAEKSAKAFYAHGHGADGPLSDAGLRCSLGVLDFKWVKAAGSKQACSVKVIS